MENDQVIREIKGCITSTKGNLTVAQLNRDFKTLVGEWIPFKKMGFSSLEQLFQLHPDFNLVKIGNEWYVTAKASTKSAHIVEMVARQKSEKRNLRRFRPGKYNPPPRMNYAAAHWENSSSWRPMANYKPATPEKIYQGSSKPEAVRHKQFLSQNNRRHEARKVKREKKKASIMNPSEPQHLRKLFIGGLNFRTTDESLKKHFEQWGEIVNVATIKEFTERSQGYGFITYSKAHMVVDAQNAIPHRVDGREIRVKPKTPVSTLGCLGEGA